MRKLPVSRSVLQTTVKISSYQTLQFNTIFRFAVIFVMFEILAISD